MKISDTLRFGLRSLLIHSVRSWLTLLAMGLGTASVVLLAALGEGARHYVLDQFSQLGTHLLIVLPGRSETTGGAPPLLGETPRDLTLDDALALQRSRLVKRLAPITVGSAPVSHGHMEREVTIVGSTADLLPVRHLRLARGRFLPPGDPARAVSVVVLGDELKSELLGNRRALGEWVRIGDRRFRIIGILETKGESLGLDLGDVAIVPVASAQALFDSPALFRILIQAPHRGALERTEKTVREIIRERHEGEDDVTIIAQDALLATFDKVLSALTLAVAGIAAVSLTVAGILIMNVMLVSVSQRTAEIGLLKALGAARRQILALFLTEALLLAGVGTLAGLLLALAGIGLFNLSVPEFQLVVPVWAALAAALVAGLTGLLFGLLPALRAARMDPVFALAER